MKSAPPLLVACAVLALPLPVTAAVRGVAGLPLTFEANVGQTSPEVRFLSRGSHHALFLTPTEAVLVLREGTAETVLRVRPLGANPEPRVTALGPLPGRVHYFIGRDPRGWHANVPTCARIRYEQVYPGVDVVYYGHQRDLEYDFVVAPGADPGAIQMAFDGADRIEIDGGGDLILHLAGRTLQQRKPVVYQDVAGVRREVRGRYALMGREARGVGFVVGPYDHSQPLVIDPTLSYSTYLGGSAWDSADAIAVDAAGNAYVTGWTESIDFPATSGAFRASRPSSDGLRDAFVAKLNPAGSALVYATYLGGNGTDEGLGIAVNGAGNAYVTGWAGPNFPTTAGAFRTSFAGPTGSGLQADAFVTKLDPAGASLVYSTYLGGSAMDLGSAIAVDATGNAYVTGKTHSSDFPNTSGAVQISRGALSDAFVTKLDSSGSSLGYSTFLGGNGYDWGFGIAVDAAGNAYVAGKTESSDFPTANAFQSTRGGPEDAFVTKVNPAGSVLLYSTYLGGGASDEGKGIAVDASGHAYVTGQTSSTDFPATAGAFQTSNASTSPLDDDAFVTKFDPAGSTLAYSTYLGGTSIDLAYAIAVDAAGHAQVTGETGSTDFPTVDAVQPALDPPSDVFVAELNPAGSALVHSTYLGGNGADEGLGVAVGASCNVYVTGTTYSTTFPTTTGALQTTAAGNGDAFVTKIANAPPAPTTTSPTGKVKTTNPTYQWQADSAATDYSLRVESLSGVVVKATYVASKICEGAICRVTPDVKLTEDRYSWYVLATNACGESLWSVKRDFVITIAQAPAAPTLISPTGTIAAQSPTYTWNAVSTAADYLLWVDGPLGNVVNTWFSASNVCSGGTCSVTPVLTLSPNTTYTWKVQARNAGGTGPWSSSLSFTIAGTTK